MTQHLDKTEAEKHVKRYEELIAEGHLPLPHSGETSACGILAKSLRLNRTTLRDRLMPSGSYETQFGLKIDAGKYSPAIVSIDDSLSHRKFADRAARAEARATAAERAAISSDILRESVFNLTSKPLRPSDWVMPPLTKGKHKEAIILLISDIHMGEVVDLDQMGGRNAYNRQIAIARLRRLFEGIVALGTQHWSGQPPGVIYAVLMGDMITGEIHEDLAETNDLLSAPAVREVSQCLISGLNLLLKSFECPIEVISLPGNHGRLTKKPRMKDFAINSYDTLAAWWIESYYHAKEEKRIRFSAPASGDALVNIHGWNVLFTHGDRIGSRGGQGFVGAAATVARGMQKIVQDYAAEGTPIDYVMVGHFHTALELEQGFANGSLVGPSEYSRTLRMRSAPATQWMLAIHPERGVSRRWKVTVGHSSEGSIYRSRLNRG